MQIWSGCGPYTFYLVSSRPVAVAFFLFYFYSSVLLRFFHSGPLQHTLENYSNSFLSLIKQTAARQQMSFLCFLTLKLVRFEDEKRKTNGPWQRNYFLRTFDTAHKRKSVLRPRLQNSLVNILIRRKIQKNRANEIWNKKEKIWYALNSQSWRYGSGAYVAAYFSGGEKKGQ